MSDSLPSTAIQDLVYEKQGWAGGKLTMLRRSKPWAISNKRNNPNVEPSVYCPWAANKIVQSTGSPYLHKGRQASMFSRCSNTVEAPELLSLRFSTTRSPDPVQENQGWAGGKLTRLAVVTAWAIAKRGINSSVNQMFITQRQQTR